MKKQKKMMSLVLTLAACASMSTVALAAESVMAESSASSYTVTEGSEVLAGLERINSEARTSDWEVTGNNVRIRSKPSLSGRILGHLDAGDIVNMGSYDESTAEADGYLWYAVRVQTGACAGISGWVVTDYLENVG